jgi:hypothetical protein
MQSGGKPSSMAEFADLQVLPGRNDFPWADEMIEVCLPLFCMD